jgi:hypothetical protein
VNFSKTQKNDIYKKMVCKEAVNERAREFKELKYFADIYKKMR